jgi:Arc-like DNA binding domain
VLNREKTMPRKRKDTTNLRLRIEPELLDKLEKARERRGRTLSGEIVNRLEQSFARERNRSTGLENAGTILDLAADAMKGMSSAQVQQYVPKLVESLKRIASQLRDEQVRA